MHVQACCESWDSCLASYGSQCTASDTRIVVIGIACRVIFYTVLLQGRFSQFESRRSYSHTQYKTSNMASQLDSPLSISSPLLISPRAFPTGEKSPETSYPATVLLARDERDHQASLRRPSPRGPVHSREAPESGSISTASDSSVLSSAWNP